MHALTIFLGAFLVFQIQPLVGKFILPWFGGGPGVWTTCLLFFQITLLAGYAYAHVVVTFLSRKSQAIVHSVLLLASLALLPIAPDEAWKAVGGQDPTLRILALLAVTIGVPYALLTSTSPLVQSWFAGRYQGRSPYRLFALSNLGALLALLTYPTLIEPFAPLQFQTWIWSATYVAFVLTYISCACWAYRGRVIESRAVDLEAAARAEPFNVTSTSTPKTSPVDVVLWIVLAAIGTVMLMATTNQICQDIATVPFLWVLPLSLYLISYIVCFDHQRWYHRDGWAVALVGSVFVAVLMLTEANGQLLGWQFDFHMDNDLIWQVAVLTATMFACVMCCHGELVQLRPPNADLTLFYLMIAVGGALGGLFVAVIAPLVFNAYTELYLGLLGSCAAVMIARRRVLARAAGHRSLPHWRRWAVAASVIALVFGAMRYQLSPVLHPEFRDVVEIDRNFYGVLTVRREVDDTAAEGEAFERLIMSHGTTIHGSQYTQGSLRHEPTTYYARKSGVSVAITNHPKRVAGSESLRIGVVGLGVGTLAAYAERDDVLRFYEINPAVVRMARKHFSYIDEAEASGVDGEILLGDARILMEQQLADSQPQQFDVLVVDAFSSDAVPVHLLTRECFALYRAHLAPGGVLAVHVTNAHLELTAVVRGLAEDGGDLATLVSFVPSVGDKRRDPQVTSSQWALLTKDASFMNTMRIRGTTIPWPSQSRPLVWTDSYTSLVQVIRWRWSDWLYSPAKSS